jgi:hypothetical protein
MKKKSAIILDNLGNRVKVELKGLSIEIASIEGYISWMDNHPRHKLPDDPLRLYWLDLLEKMRECANKAQTQISPQSIPVP